MGNKMRFLMVMNEPELAKFACSVPGVDPFVDLEVLGKQDRQGHLSTWKSTQTVEDVSKIRKAVPDAHLVVRVNPIHDRSHYEIDDVIARGADSIMLPMFSDSETLGHFLEILNDRAQPLPLFETASAVEQIPQMIEKFDLKTLHIGLNDLHLDLAQDFIFQPVADGYLERPCEALRSAGVQFGIGGLARAREGVVSPEWLLGEHVRLGSSVAILSQTFHRHAQDLESLNAEMDFAAEVGKLQMLYATFKQSSAEILEANRLETRDRIYDVVNLIRQKRTI